MNLLLDVKAASTGPLIEIVPLDISCAVSIILISLVVLSPNNATGWLGERERNE